MRYTDMIKKAFVGGEWSVGYRRRGEEKYSVIQLDRGWIADPFLFEHRGEHYLFAEYVNGKKGEIVYFRFVNDKPVFGKVILSEPYHLSYPCVFCRGNDIFMIPESADNHSVDLYRAVSFPDRWKKIGRLAQGIYYDSTYVSSQGKDWLVTYSPRKGIFQLGLWEIDMDERQARLIAAKEYGENVGRPAGNFFVRGETLIRPAQDCSKKYGEKLLFYQVTDMKKDCFEEREVQTVSVQDTGLPFQRIHTYNSDSVYETVDLFRERIKPFRVFGIIMKKVRQRMG